MTTNMTPANAIIAPLALLRTLEPDTVAAIITLIRALEPQITMNDIRAITRALDRFPTSRGPILAELDRL